MRPPRPGRLPEATAQVGVGYDRIAGDHAPTGAVDAGEHTMLNIALFGPPGAGKGTQSEFLIKKYNLFYISTGDLLRKEMANRTKLGQDAQSIIAAGELVSERSVARRPRCRRSPIGVMLCSLDSVVWTSNNRNGGRSG